jgi:hypothetical protein
MLHDCDMSDLDLSGPDPETITTYILEAYPDTDVVELDGAAWFFSLDSEKHFPNYATIVTTDEFDQDRESSLSRPGVFRLNIGVDRATFDRLVGQRLDPDYAALDQVLPHPVYARQHWLCILNPSTSTFEGVVVPLLKLAYERLAAQRARHTGRGTT